MPWVNPRQPRDILRAVRTNGIANLNFLTLGVLLISVSACGRGGGDMLPAAVAPIPFTYTGTPGQPVPANFAGDLLADVSVRLNGGPETFFTVDTGAPLTILNTQTFTDRTDGTY